MAVPAPLPSISISDAYFQVLQSLQIRANEIIAQTSANVEDYKNGFESRGDRGTDDIKSLQDNAAATRRDLEAHHKTEVEDLNAKYDKFVKYHEDELQKREDWYGAQLKSHDDRLQRENDWHEKKLQEH